MGTENLWIDFKGQNISYNEILKLYEKSPKYYRAFNFFYKENEEFKFCVSIIVPNFFPAVLSVFNFFKHVINNEEIEIKTLSYIRKFDFESDIEFLNFMFRIWHKQIEHFHNELGMFLIDPKKFRKSYLKFRKKYFLRTCD